MVAETPLPNVVIGLVLVQAWGRMQILVIPFERTKRLGDAMVISELKQSIQAELIRLQLHPVNLDVVSEEGSQVLLRGSLLTFWKVPKTVDAAWFLQLLTTLPDNL